jgi:polyisoprenyl-teichoic acid--peptidoglycan teichoic acid transferase
MNQNQSIQPNQNSEQLEPRRKKRIFPIIFWLVVIGSLLFIGSYFTKAYNLTNGVFVNQTSFFKRITNILDGDALKGESSGQVNVLILGFGGAKHDGPYLTDSIILASIRPETNEVLLSTIPRDYLWKNGNAVRKINAAYSDGLAKHDSHAEAGNSATKAVSEITGLEIPYFVSIDFSGFEQAVDRLGGLDIKVERSFTDYQFPNDATKGYLPPLSFKKGAEHMDGERALQFARSRHAEGPEASDFARSKRQAKIIEAFKAKALSLNLITDYSKVNDLLDILSDHLHTNLEPNEVLRLAKMNKSEQTKLQSQSLDEETGLICPGFEGEDENRQFVLSPCSGVSKNDIIAFFKQGFELAPVKGEQASVILENSTTETKLYNKIKKSLQLAGVTIYETPYKGLPLNKSVLYTVSEKPATIRYIEEELNIKSQPIPGELKASSDLVLIIGKQ